MLIVALLLLALALPALASAADGTIAGEVTESAGGAPVQEALICAEGPALYELEEEACVSSEADGSYELSVPAGQGYLVWFARGASGKNLARQFYDGHARRSEADLVQVSSGATTGPIDGQLREGGSISGNVTAVRNRAPIEGVEVCATLEPGEDFDGCTTTAADGNYTLTGLREGPHVVEFWARGYLEQFYPGSRGFFGAQTIGVTAGNDTPAVGAELELESQIRGHVYSAGGTQPLSGIVVCAIDGPSGSLENCSTSEADGGYLIPYLEAGSYKVGFSIEWSEFFPGEIDEPDGWPTQYWNLKPTLAAADPISIPEGMAATNVNARLGYTAPVYVPAPPPPVVTPPAAAPLPKRHSCPKHKRLVTRHGRTRCVVSPHRHHHPHRHKRRHHGG